MLNNKTKKAIRSDGKAPNRPFRIAITTEMIAKYSRTTINNIYQLTKIESLLLNDSDIWIRFWSLVRYLEKKHLRPINPF